MVAPCHLEGGGVRPIPPGSMLIKPEVDKKINWLRTTGKNSEGITTLEVEISGDTARTFAADGTQLMDAHIGELSVGPIGLWAEAGTTLEVYKLEVKPLPQRTNPPAAPLVFGDKAPELPARYRIGMYEFGQDDPKFEENQRGAKNGHFTIAGTWASGWSGWNICTLTGDPKIPGDLDFAVEAVARVKGDANAKWGLNFTNSNKANAGSEYGVYVQLSSDCKVAVLPGKFEKSKLDKVPLVAPKFHSSIKTGPEYNRLLVVVQNRVMRVYVNGNLICGRTTLTGDVMTPMAVAFTVETATAAELQKLSAYSLIPPTKP